MVLRPSARRLARRPICLDGLLPLPALSPLLARARASTTNGTSGRRGSVSSASATLQSCLESKCRARMDSRGSTLFRLVWKRRPTLSQRLIYALRASARRMLVNDCTSWPTPRAADGAKGGKRRVPTGQGSERPEGRRDRADGRTATEPSGLCAPRAVADPAGPRRRGRSVRSQHRGGQAPLCAHDARRTAGARQPERGCAGSLADALRERRQGDKRRARTGQQPLPARGSVVGHAASAGLALGSEPPARQGTLRLEGPSAPAASHWSDVVWLPCLDGRVRPAPAGVFPLAHGVPNRVGTLRGAGNAIVPQIAAEFIAAYMEVRA